MRRQAWFLGWVLSAVLVAGGASGAEDVLLYVVKPGDTLMSIASEQLAGGAREFRRLAAHNGLKDANVIAPGTQLRIPTAWLRRQAATVRVVALAGEVKSGERGLKSGDALAEGDRVRSGPTGHATLEFADKSVVQVKPGTELVLEGHKASPSLTDFETRLRLGAGAIEAVVARQRAQQFRVRTPTANMAVRGTAFRVRDVDGSTQAEVTEGRVAVAGDKGREVALDAGFGTVVRAGEAPAAPVRLLEAPDLSGVPELHERPTVRIMFARLAGAVSYRFVAAEDREMRNVVAETPLRGPAARLVDLRDGEIGRAHV